MYIYCWCIFTSGFVIEDIMTIDKSLTDSITAWETAFEEFQLWFYHIFMMFLRIKNLQVWSKIAHTARRNYGVGMPWLQCQQSFFKGWPPIYLVQRLVQEGFPLAIRIILMILVARRYDQGFHAYKIEKFQSIRSITMVETNNTFHIIIFDQWLQ